MSWIVTIFFRLVDIFWTWRARQILKGESKRLKDIEEILLYYGIGKDDLIPDDLLYLFVTDRGHDERLLWANSFVKSLRRDIDSKILLTENQFRSLIKGKIVKAGEIEIALCDIGYSRMIDIIESEYYEDR